MSAFRIRLPATSANLGAAFDSAAVALDLYLTVDAEPADAFSIAATGRNAEICGRLDGNLIVDTYAELVKREGRNVQPLALHVENQIPLGMGCGSSAAGRLAAIAMASHFGQLGWDDEKILAEASAGEGHPDNAAACWLGGMVAAAEDARARIHVARVEPPAAWMAIVAVPESSLATSKARGVLPAQYARADVVANLQAASLLGLAFAQGRGELLQHAMRDRVHQPYREGLCELLPPLLPLSGKSGILGVALSGAGPAVLLIVESSRIEDARLEIASALGGTERVEVLEVQFAAQGGASSRSRRDAL